MRLHPACLALAAALATATTALALAQEQPAPAAQAAPTEQPAVQTAMPSTPVERPSRGLTMEKVEAKFGAPSQKLESVGQPPITRWEYPGFVVYFEHEYVLHTVAVK